MRASATGTSPLVDLHRQSSMASLAPPTAQQTLPHRRSMANFATSPQINQRRTSLLPPSPVELHQQHQYHQQLNHAMSMHHLALPPSSPTHHLSSSPTMPNAFLQPDPRYSMSMTNLHAQAYLQQQQQQQQMHMQAMQRPAGMAQTMKVSSRTRPPLVSLYGDVVPSSAVQQRRT